MERRHEPLAPMHVYLTRLLRGILSGFVAIAIALYVGMLGYHFFERMSWIDAFTNASMILSGMGPLGALHYESGKIFAGCYALFSGLAFILIMGLIFGPIFHRFFHKFHLDTEK
ncbi:MAG: hypothetical protein M3R00_09955 [Pseudomonadota bacterium]|nr:hypothetical protein [Pseudomonadota bacterium]